jgi:hypothetical protein
LQEEPETRVFIGRSILDEDVELSVVKSKCRRGDLIVIKKHRILPDTLVEIPADYEESEVGC